MILKPVTSKFIIKAENCAVNVFLQCCKMRNIKRRKYGEIRYDQL